MKKGLMQLNKKTVIEDREVPKSTLGHRMTRSILIQKELGHAHHDAAVDHRNISLIVVTNAEIILQVAADPAIVTSNVTIIRTETVTTTVKVTINQETADITIMVDADDWMAID
jgi:hypothetical protein